MRLPEEDPRPGLRGGLLGPEPLTAGQSRAAPPAEGGASAACGRPGEQAGELSSKTATPRHLEQTNYSNSRGRSANKVHLLRVRLVKCVVRLPHSLWSVSRRCDALRAVSRICPEESAIFAS